MIREYLEYRGMEGEWLPDFISGRTPCGWCEATRCFVCEMPFEDNDHLRDHAYDTGHDLAYYEEDFQKHQVELDIIELKDEALAFYKARARGLSLRWVRRRRGRA